jgi:hypothetical protein
MLTDIEFEEGINFILSRAVKPFIVSLPSRFNLIFS